MKDEAVRQPLTILGIAGSLRHGSYNRGLIRAAIELAPAGTKLVSHDLGDLPLYNADVEAQGDPEPVARLKRAIAAADALLIATPEYNHCVPGVLKNAMSLAEVRRYKRPKLHDAPLGPAAPSQRLEQIESAELLVKLSLAWPDPEPTVMAACRLPAMPLIRVGGRSSERWAGQSAGPVQGRIDGTTTGQRGAAMYGCGLSVAEATQLCGLYP